MLKDRDARVRENGVRLAEKSLATSRAMAAAVLDLVEDPDAKVRFQVALTLGERDDDANVVALSELALQAVDDPWTRQAVASSIANRPGALAYILVQDEEGLTKHLTSSRLLLLQELAMLIGSRRDRTEVTLFCSSLLELQGKDRLRWQLAGFTGLADGMGRRGTRLGDFLKTMPAIEGFLLQAAKVGGDTKREAAERLEAIRLLAHAPKDVAEPVLLRLLTDDPLPDVRLAAVRALSAQPGADTARVLMQSWQVYTPAVRREVIEAMLRQPDRIQFLLGELEGKRITPGDLDAPSTRRLLNHTRVEIRDRAQKLLKDNLPEERKKVLLRYQESLTLKGDALRGRDVFKQQCGNCHLIAGVGLQVGPDISDTRTKTAEMLLLDILNPNAAIDANFVNYQVVTRSGKSATGLIAAETAASITLRRAENQTEVILRQDIEEIRSSGQSLMPEGVEKVITVAQMADLLAFLKNWRYLDGTVPVGIPEKK
jgi:putative heme-binding domain-containing protein